MKMTTRLFMKVIEDKHIGHILWLLRMFWLHVCHRAPFLSLWLLQEIVSENSLFDHLCQTRRTYCSWHIASLYHKYLQKQLI